MKYTPTFWLDTNYALSVGLPMDSRTVVGSVANLTTKDVWMKDEVCIAYNGMLVGVANTDNIEESGLYYLFDPNCKSSLQSPDVQDSDNWIKLCSPSALNKFTETINGITSSLQGITADIDDLKDKFSALETKLQSVENSVGTIPEGSALDIELSNMDSRIAQVEVFPDIIFGGSAQPTSEV